MDDVTVYGGSFEECLINLEIVLNRCIEKNLVLNWEKCHFMVNQGIVLGYIISNKGIEVDKAKIEMISKLPSPTKSSTCKLGTKFRSMTSSLKSPCSWLKICPGMPTLPITRQHVSYQFTGRHKIGNFSLQKFTPIIGKNPSCANTMLIR